MECGSLSFPIIAYQISIPSACAKNICSKYTKDHVERNGFYECNIQYILLSKSYTLNLQYAFSKKYKF